MAKPFRAVIRFVLAAALVAGPAVAPARTARKDVRGIEAWTAGIVTKIAKADLKTAGGTGQGGTVTIRVRIAADGTLEGAAVEKRSASEALDERALNAVKAAAPFAPPPPAIVTLEGFTEISFPLDLEPTARRMP